MLVDSFQRLPDRIQQHVFTYLREEINTAERAAKNASADNVDERQVTQLKRDWERSIALRDSLTR